jgi:FAD/FMN-containing dehydrogenase
MNGVVVGSDHRTAQISGGARAADVLAMTDPLQVAPVVGSVGAVGMTGFTLGGGYGALIGRFGLALDNLLAAKVVLAEIMGQRQAFARQSPSPRTSTTFTTKSANSGH